MKTETLTLAGLTRTTDSEGLVCANCACPVTSLYSGHSGSDDGCCFECYVSALAHGCEVENPHDYALVACAVASELSPKVRAEFEALL